MRRPVPLPPTLRHRTFTRQEALAAGVPDKRLRARDVERVARGVYRHPSADDDAPGLLHALCERAPGLWLSHETAAQVYGLPLPARIAGGDEIHVSGSFRSSTCADLGNVRQHGPVKNLEGEVQTREGLRLSSPERVFIELMPRLLPDELVVLGDALVRRPRPSLEGRASPWTTRERLQDALAKHGHTRGIVAARDALAQVRVGADSPPETLLRLRLVEAGHPEPELQVRADPDDPRSPTTDLGYRRRRLAIQYDGAHHFAAEQQADDEWRDAGFHRRGWTVLRSNRVDLREGFVGVVARVGALLAG